MVPERRFGIRLAQIAVRMRRNAVYHEIEGSLER
jgi:hypothetical protein